MVFEEVPEIEDKKERQILVRDRKHARFQRNIITCIKCIVPRLWKDRTDCFYFGIYWGSFKVVKNILTDWISEETFKPLQGDMFDRFWWFEKEDIRLIY